METVASILGAHPHLFLYAFALFFLSLSILRERMSWGGAERGTEDPKWALC